MERHIIFHIPMHLDRARASASQIRPLKLLQAFQELGYEVDVVEGYGKERKLQIKTIKQKIAQGTVYDFVYSESSTMPTLMTEKHHLPTYPCLDFSFLKFCKKRGIKIGLFYRDIHWCFINKDFDWKQRIAKWFYRYDLYQYRHLLDVLFLPSLEMFPHIPFYFKQKVQALPAGCEIFQHKEHTPSDTLRLLYIGGIGGNYDLRHLVEAASHTENVELTLCCRTDDWQLVHQDYEKIMNNHIHLVHAQGQELDSLYQNADLFAMFFYSEYIQFAVPFKLFEAIGHHIPLLAVEDTWTGNYISEKQIGQCCKDEVEHICRVLETLKSNPQLLEEYRQRLEEVSLHNSWQERCKTIAKALSSQQADF